MVDEYNLNNATNLNQKVYKPLPKQLIQEKLKKIKEWNEIPEIKEKNIEAIDKDKFKKVGKIKFNFLKILACLGVLALLIVAFSVAYSTYENGALFPGFVCGNDTVICEAQECSNICGDCVCNSTCPEFPDKIKFTYENETS